MDEYNMYPNSGQYFTPTFPKDQQKAKAKEIQETLDQLPLLKQVIKRLDDRIAFYDSLSSIQVDIDKDPLVFQKVHAANQLTKNNLAAERSYILSRIEKTLKR